MNITQTFYDHLASQYDKLFLDWHDTVREQAVILDRIFRENGFDQSVRILDCACGIGTQAIGLAALGYPVTASDISEGELAEAKNAIDKLGLKLEQVHHFPVDGADHAVIVLRKVRPTPAQYPRRFAKIKQFPL